MNDVTFVEASRVLAERMMNEGGTTPEERIALRASGSRRPVRRASPSGSSLRRARSTYQLRRFPVETRRGREATSNQGESPRDPKLDAAELAAYTTVASIILNLDETITKE